ncbi:gamma-glutamyltransferase family protein [Maridesulfovibrio hydrothermalis]|uniref:Gamma-glutamyltransferase n=1 Tax=Maridesulfovibrio hydrothermalis AM13 = DSM 14728 TaxID=1121451 RepID=L0R730_9BACT|nr:gamma-glutamyltransferase family protein [Maridesulfovibrio hydrothermalis]CCO22523.1 Gamma-glutamyltransferase [Maridesulfovibrio hydrothermalis AM13 = DSM 14728]
MSPYEISDCASIDFTFNSRRTPVYATKGMVATSQPLATEAGLEMLRAGGNAADAAIAVASALAVIEPCSTGLGGDAFALYYSQKNKKISALNGSGKSPQNLSLEKVAALGISGSLPKRHALTVNVPGALAMWCDLIERHGSLPLSTIFAPAIRYAEEGFPVSPVTAHMWKEDGDEVLKTSPGGSALLLNGEAPRTGEIMTSKAMGDTLRKLAEGSPDDAKKLFYKGEIADKIVQIVQDNGGFLSKKDMAEHTSLWQDSIKTNYRGYEIHECPPNGQGLAALIALNTLSNIELDKIGAPDSAERLHHLIEAMRMGFADARQHIADPDVYACPTDKLLSRKYGAERAACISPDKANPDSRSGVPVNSSDTVYFCIVDKDGNGCSLVNSIYMGFGTGIIPDGLGFPLQNRGHNFSLDPAHPNVLAGGKRSYHTIIPGICLRADHSLHSVFGVMGGFMQPQGHIQVITAMLDDDATPQEALNRLRFCIEPGEAGGRVCTEEGIPEETVEELIRMGHEIDIRKGYNRTIFGRGQIITRDAKTRTLCGGCDPRSDGQVSGIC